jgi:hypothetical protein
MSNLRAKLRERMQRIYDQVTAHIPEIDGRRDETEAEDQLTRYFRARLDPDKAARTQAKDLINALTRVPGEEDDDDSGGEIRQLRLPFGGDAYSINLKRLVRDGTGGLYTETSAPLAAKLDDAARASANARRVGLWSDRKTQEANHMMRWEQEQRRAGRSESELTWGNCIIETGLLAA